MSTLKNTPDNQPSVPAFNREQFPFYWIVNVYARYTQIMEIKLKKSQLDVSRFRVLMIIHQYGKASISQISEHSMTKMPTVTKIVGRLRDDGLVTTAQSQQDARVTEVMLTAIGQEKVEEAQRIANKIFEKGLKGISSAQMGKMNISLDLILQNLNEI